MKTMMNIFKDVWNVMFGYRKKVIIPIVDEEEIATLRQVILENAKKTEQTDRLVLEAEKTLYQIEIALRDRSIRDKSLRDSYE